MLRRIIVIGAGIGGLTTAALVARTGYDVTLLEAQPYPGGCASTFTHKGFRFDSGATVIGGFQPAGPHAIISELLNITFPIHRHNPAWITHLPDCSVSLDADNDDVLTSFPETEAFWQQQNRIADLGWKLSSAGLPWLPGDIHEALQLAKVAIAHFPEALRAVPFAFMNVFQWLKRHNLHTNREFIRFLDAQLLISAQTTTNYVNAMYSAAALDLARQGVYYVEGGIGIIAQLLAHKLQSFGGTILYRHTVTRIMTKHGQATGVYVRHGRRAKSEQFFPADFVLANVTPWDLNRLLGESSPSKLQREVQNRRPGWGAFVLHLGLKEEAIPPDFPEHHQIIRDAHSPLGETNSIFMSISPAWDRSRAPEGQRAITITTHANVQQWWDLYHQDKAQYDAKKQEYTQQMVRLVEDRLLPGFGNALTLTLPGTPLTYNFYTNRHQGMVGGFPQTSLFKVRNPRTGIANLRLVGDSIFPGQSTAGVTIGAMRVAADVR